jgi:hypothetical protein
MTAMRGLIPANRMKTKGEQIQGGGRAVRGRRLPSPMRDTGSALLAPKGLGFDGRDAAPEIGARWVPFSGSWPNQKTCSEASTEVAKPGSLSRNPAKKKNRTSAEPAAGTSQIERQAWSTEPDGDGWA